MTELLEEKKGPLAWFASNHVAANLLMVLIVAAGLLTIFTMKVEIFPELSVDMIIITVPYRGATPAEVEEGVCLRVEEKIVAVDGIKKIYSTAAEGAGMITVEVDEYADTKEVLDDIKAEIDTIITFPEETEKPIITEIKTRSEVVTIVIYGDASERTLKEIANEIRDDLTAMDNISQVYLFGVRPYEMSIEISEENLRRYGLSFDQVAAAVRESSLDIPAGSVRTAGGEVLVRTKGQKYTGPEFERIIVLTRTDGTRIRLGDIATVVDGFDDSEMSARFDGQPASSLKVFRVGDQDALDVADTVKKYIQDKKGALPESISISTWDDRSVLLRSRIDLLKRNGYIGLTLVFICLTLFLDIRLAFWTTMGIPISFLGAFWLMPIFDVSLNMISLFAFILSLGIVVDDAIVVGENIFTYRQQGMDYTKAAIKGVREMVGPVTIAVLTTVCAFTPLLYITGMMGKFLRVIPIVVISVLVVSLVEALLILPAHLSGKRRKSTGKNNGPIVNFHRAISGLLEKFVRRFFNPFAMFAVRWRYVTLAFGMAILITTIGLIIGGRIKVVFIDSVEADNMVATLTMPQGTPIEKTVEVVKRIETAAEQVRREFDAGRKDAPSIFKHIATTIGQHPADADRGPESTTATGVSSAHLAEVNIELLGGEERDVSSTVMKNRWRELVGEIPGISTLRFVSELLWSADDINVELSHKDFDKLLAATEQLKYLLGQYEGVGDISDSFEEGKQELKLALKDTGRTLGLTLSDLARQVRQGFYGEEAQRIQRGRDDVRVMIRYPKEERKSISNIENMRIRLPGGTEIPFKLVADVQYGRAFSSIRRVDRRRVVTVSADVDEAQANANEINDDLEQTLLPELRLQYPGLQFRFGGEQEARAESFGSLRTAFPIALLAIYGLLAVQFKSYIQPVIVMSAIPFGLVGATMGHIVMGFNLGLLSMFGIVALSGVVVNDSLIMIDLINRERAEGIELGQVVSDSVTRRFRPIMLTTLTTFFGLAPMLLEKSLQARFLIPMAISLAFGVAFATLITLILVPSLYMILEDVKAIPAMIRGKKAGS